MAIHIKYMRPTPKPVKLFLENKIAECELLSKKRRKKYETVRALYVALITFMSNYVLDLSNTTV